MINSYLILNRKTSFIIKLFISNLFILFVLVIWGINTFYYQNFIEFHSKTLFFDSYYFIEVLIPVKEVKQIAQEKQLFIDSKLYNYQIYKIDANAIYMDNVNYQKVYLKVFELDDLYRINGYEMDVKFYLGKKKLIDYLKDEKEV